MSSTQSAPWRWLRLVPVLALVHGCRAPSGPAPVTPFGAANRFVSLEIRSRLSASFQLVHLRVLLDAAPVHLSGADGPGVSTSRPLQSPICAARPSVAAGTHDVAVEAVLRGHGYGIFSYLGNYRFPVRSRARVDIPRDALGAVVIGTVYEGGSVTTPLEDRPRVRWDVRVATEPGSGCFP